MTQGVLGHGFAHEGEYGVVGAMMLQLGCSQPQAEGIVHSWRPLRGTCNVKRRGATVDALKCKCLLPIEW